MRIHRGPDDDPHDTRCDDDRAAEKREEQRLREAAEKEMYRDAEPYMRRQRSKEIKRETRGPL